MASTQTWSEGNGTNAGTETTSVTNVNWKNADSPDTGGGSAYSANPITAGQNSFTKYQAIKYAGTFNSLSSLSYYASTSAPLDNASGAGNLTVTGKVITAASPATPATSLSGDSAIATSAGVLTANFIQTSTWTSVFATGTATAGATTPVYGQALRTQLQTAGATAPGDIATVTITAQWTES